MRISGALNTITFGGLMPLPSVGGGAGTTALDLVVNSQSRTEVLSGRDVCRLHFAPEADELNEEHRAKLKGVWEAAVQAGTICEVLVAAYADQDYPRTGTALPPAACELAMRRGQAVVAHLLDLGAPHPRLISMAKRANWLQSLFLTDESQLKGSLEATAQGDDAPNSGFYQEVGAFLEIDGGPGRVVVIVHCDRLYAH